MKRVSKRKTRIPKFFGVVFELPIIKKIDCFRLQLLYKTHLKIRYLHDIVYSKNKTYKKYSDKPLTDKVHKVSLVAFIVSFIFFTTLQYVLPTVFNFGTPNKASAASISRSWTTKEDFQTLSSTSIKLSGDGQTADPGDSHNDDNATFTEPTYSWTTMQNTGAPDQSLTMDPNVVGGDKKFIVWGGLNSSDFTGLNTGKIYDVASNTWSATSTAAGVPVGRARSAAVWTGETGNTNTENRMIVWSGYPYTNTGAVYNTTNNTWSSMSTTNAPAAREKSKAVWTGSNSDPTIANRMIVWGGYSSNTGGIYDLVNNSWSSISTTNAPNISNTPDNATVYWTGETGNVNSANKMILWNSNYFTSRIYDIKNNTWSDISATNAPTSGILPVVFTGNKLIVMSYGATGVPYNQHHIYDIATNTWSTISLTNLPLLSNYYLFWNGSKVVLWSASTNLIYFYDLVNDTWTQGDSTGGPTANRGSAYIRGDKKMFFWGGTIAGNYSNTGAFYGFSYPMTGTLGNARIDAGVGAKAKWNTINWTGTTPSQGSSTTAIKFKTRGTNVTTQSILDNPDSNMTGNPDTGWTYWNQDNSGNTYYTVTGSSISTPQTRFLDIQATLSSNDGALTPTLGQFSVSYDTLEAPSNLTLAKSDNTSLSVGGFTNETSVKVKATNLACTDCGTSTQRKIEVEAYTTTPTGNPTATGDYNDATHDSTATLTDLLPNTVYKLKIRASDQQGRQTDWVDFNSGNTAFTIDQTAPTVSSYTITGSNVNGSYAKANTIDLLISAADTVSGLAQMRFSNNGSAWSDWENYSATKSGWDLTNAAYGGSVGDGPKTVYLNLRDNAGNVSGDWRIDQDAEWDAGTKSTITTTNGAIRVSNATNWIPGIAPLSSTVQVYSQYTEGIFGGVGYYCTSPQCATSHVLTANNSVDFSAYPLRDACKLLGARLPSLSELQQIQQNKAYYGITGAFANSLFASNQESAMTTTYNVGISMANGSQSTNLSKSSSYSTRCVRDNGGTYEQTGTYTSEVKDFGTNNLIHSTIAWSPDSQPAGTALIISVRGGNVAAPDGTWTDYAILNNGSAIPDNIKSLRYLQFKAILSSDNTFNSTPTIDFLLISTSHTASISLDTNAPDSFALSGPSSGTWQAMASPNFSWTPSIAADVVRQELWVASTAGGQPVLNKTINDRTTASTAMTGTFASEGQRSWLVKAYDGAGNVTSSPTWTIGYDSDNSPGPVVNQIASTNNNDRVRVSWDKFADSGSPITKYKIERIKSDRITDPDWSVGDNNETGYAIFEIDNPVGSPVLWDFSTEAPLNQIPQYQTDQYTIYPKLVSGTRYSYRVVAKDLAYDNYDMSVNTITVGYTDDRKAPYSPSATVVTPCADSNCDATDANGNVNAKGHSNKVTWTKSYDEGTGLEKYNIYRSITNYTPENLLNQETDRGDWTLVGSLPIVSENLDPTIWYDNDGTNTTTGTSLLNDYVRYYYRVTAVDKNNNESKLIPLFNTEYTVTANNNNPALDPNTFNSAFGRTVDVTAPEAPTTFYVIRRGIDASNITQKVEIRWSDADDFIGQDAVREPRVDGNGIKLLGSGIKEYKLYYSKEDEDGEGNPLGTYGAYQEFVFDINDPTEYSKTNGLNAVIQTGLKDYWNYKFKIKVIDNATPSFETEYALAQPVKTFSSAIPSSPNVQVNSTKTGANTGKTVGISFPGSKSKAHNIVKYELYRGTVYNSEDGPEWTEAAQKIQEFTPAVTHFDDSGQTYTHTDTPLDNESEGSKTYYYMVKVTDDTTAEEGGPFVNYSNIDKNSLHSGWDTTPDISAPSAPPVVSVKDTYPNNQYVRNVITWQIPTVPTRRKMSYESCTVTKTVGGVNYCSDFAKYEVWQEKYHPVTKVLVSDNKVYTTINFYDNIFTDNIVYEDLLPGLNPQDYIYKYYVLVYDNAGTDFKYNDVAKTVINSSSNTSTKAYAPDPIIPSQTTPALATGTSVQILEKGVSSAVIYWETNQEADSLVEYREQGSTSAYIAVGDRNRQLTHTVRIFDLKTDTTYEYRVVSRNKLGNDMVITNVPILRTEKFKIEIPTNPEAFMKVTTTSIQFTWTTTKDAKTNYIEYEAKNDPNNPQLRGIAGQLATSDGYDLKTHQVVLKGLRSNTEYRFKVKSVSTDNYQDEKPEGASNYLYFTTSKYDTSQFTMVPSSSNVSEKNITSTSAQIVWETANPTVSKVFYGTSPAEGSQNNSAGSGELSTNHVAKIEGLVPGTKYYYYVQATDEFGNTYTSKIFSFTAILKPKISGFNISSIKPYEITISWTTNVDTETIVNWGKTAAYGEKRGKNELTKNHLLVIDKLEDNTEYHMQIVAHDETGEEVVDADKIIRTPLDTEGPKIESVKTDILPMGASDETGSVIISWNTNKPASTMVEYDEGIISGRYGMRSVEDKTLNLSHTVIIKELKPASSYHYRIISRDKRGNTTQSQDFTFVTPSKEKSILQLILKSLEETFSWTKNLNQFFANIGKRIRGQ